jgi:8-oxo-dGTP pyrophosphatase MutT (NUDIX family)
VCVLAILPDGRALFLNDRGKHDIPSYDHESDMEDTFLSERMTAQRGLYEETGLFISNLSQFKDIYSEFGESRKGVLYSWVAFIVYLDAQSVTWCRQVKEREVTFLHPKEVWLDLIDRGYSPLRSLLDHYLNYNKLLILK